MTSFENQILSTLANIKGGGAFFSSGTQPFIFPGLEIRGMDEIAFPLNALQIKEIIKKAHKAPFGKGAETILDTNVRSAWEIDANKISFNNPAWETFIQQIIGEIKPDLGIEKHEISANLYKLLIYEEGDFFLAHKDSEKEKGMFGTLIVGLPSKHTGGILSIRFDGHEENVDFSDTTSQYNIPYTAFYADCEHEIKPITSGYRVCLVYNLVQTKGKEKIQLDSLEEHIKTLASILKTCENDKDIPKIVLLGHQYTPSNFTMEGLKLNDRPKAETLIAAAEKAGFYAKLGLVTSYQSGSLEYNPSGRNSRRRSYYDEYDDDEDLTENGEMGEVYDEYIEIEHWMEGGIPPLRGLQFEETDLIKDFDLNEGEPDEKEAEGYTGNAGMEMQYWYHYGAVFLWPKKYHADLLDNDLNKLEWIEYYNTIWEKASISEKNLAKQLVEATLTVTESSNNCDAVAGYLINLKDDDYMADNGIELVALHFKNITVNQWINLFETYPIDYFEGVFRVVSERQRISFTKHLIDILLALQVVNNSKFKGFLDKQIEQMPVYLNGLKLANEKKHDAVKTIVANVIYLSSLKNTNETWIRDTKLAFMKTLNRTYVNEVLVGTIFAKKLMNWNLAKELLLSCGEDLSQRVDNKPQPPENWTRPVPEGKYHQKVWGILTEFLQSPTQQVFIYQKVQAERSEMESAIRNVTIDLDLETIRKGSPHTLKLTKNQANYQREMVLWNEDVVLLREIERVVG
jgi:hypothetical protein